MAPMLLNDVQQLNYTNLATVRDAAREDPIAACCRYGISRDLLEMLSKLTPENVMHIVARLGDEVLFPPREDLGTLLSAPPTVMPLLAAANGHGRRAGTKAHQPNLTS